MPSANTALDSLLTRYSQGIKHLRAPGSAATQLQTLVQAALQAPDHGELVPIRLVTVQGAARERLANLFAAHAMGFAGKMLSGDKARAPAIVQAFCEAGESLVGWVSLGTAVKPVRPRVGSAGQAPLRHWTA